MNNKLEKFWTHINYRSDFTLSEQFIDREGATINPLSMDWRIVYTVPCSAPRTYIASYENGVLTNATVDTETNTIYVSFDNHGLSIGVLVATIEYSLPNSTFADGSQTIVKPKITGVKLWDGASDCIKAEPSVFVLNYVRGPKGADGESAYQLAQSAGYEGTEQELAQALERVPSIPEVLVINTTKLALRNAEYGRELYDKILEAKTNALPLMATPSNTVTTQRIINLQYDANTSAVLLVVEDIPKTIDNGATYAERLVFYHIASDGTITKEEYKGNVGEGVKFTPQELTDAQQAQVRANIGVPTLIGVDMAAIGNGNDTAYYKALYNAIAEAQASGNGFVLYSASPANRNNISGVVYSQANQWVELHLLYAFSTLDAGIVGTVKAVRITSTGALSVLFYKEIKIGVVDGAEIIAGSVPLSALNGADLARNNEGIISAAQDYTDTAIQNAITSTLNTPV
jgi:hypothetical protein